MKQDIIIYDIEIVNAISPKNTEERIEGIQYAAGWKDYDHLGISVIAAYSYNQDRFFIFCQDNVAEFQELIRDAFIVGFNSESFDDTVCRANGIQIKTSYDILREIYKAKDLDPYPATYTKEYKGYGLDAVCRANNLGEKSGHGARAPIDWQQGRIGTVINYCLNDVRLMKALYDQIRVFETFIDPVTGDKFYI